jgi:N-carbamoyl-L-amino-acid hydrolase
MLATLKSTEPPMPRINPDRVLANLATLRQMGAYKSGVHRPTFSPQHMQSLEWLRSELAAAGLDAEIDGIGNVFGLSRSKGPVLLTGSHLESQNHAGWLDGPLGVIYGLEAARAFAEDSSCAGLGIDVASWCDEEGHFSSFTGSRSALGLLSDSDIDAARNRYDGTPLRDALARVGLAGRQRRQIEARRYAGYFEAHIEQGDSLEAAGLAIGVVTAIVGIWQFRVTFEGVQNHAGTTRMAIRKDAGVALVEVCSAIRRRFPEVAGPRSVWTTGRITLDPGAPSIIPGGAEMLFQIRDTDEATLRRMEGELRAIVATENANGPCRGEVHVVSKSIPAKMSEAFQKAIDGAAERHAPGRHVRMPSGAGHDAQWFARVMPAAMLFVPSIGGISHHWTENTSDADIVLGAQVYADACENMLRAAGSTG